MTDGVSDGQIQSCITRNNALLVTAQVDLCKQLLSTLDLIIDGALTKAGKRAGENNL